MVLLLHWSMLNYAAVVKILKKHGEWVAACMHGMRGRLDLPCGIHLMPQIL